MRPDRSLVRGSELLGVRIDGHELAAARSLFSDPLAFRRRDEIDALLRQCDAVRA